MTDRTDVPARMNSAQAWVTYLSKVELPVLANTLRNIGELTDSTSSTVNELANVILNDAQLTSQVLRLSNTVFYNQTRTQVSTVSRAITLIGFDAVKSMAISSLIVDTLLQRSDRPHLLRCLARALHAAVQARCLLPRRNSQAQEEVFIGALLMNIGELTFWSCDTEQADELELRLHGDESEADAQRAVLHTTFVTLTRGLVEAWALGPFIREVVAPGQARSPEAHLVQLSVELARAAEQGWHSEAVARVLTPLARATGESVTDLPEQLTSNAEEVVQIASSLGIPQVAQLLPGNQPESTDQPRQEAPVRDADVQLQLLRELTRVLTEKPDINTVCQLVSDGIQRAVGLQRVALLMTDRSGDTLVPRRVAGPHTEGWKADFRVPRNGHGELGELLPHGTAIYRPPSDAPGTAADPWLGRVPALTGALVANGRLLGMFYADNAGAPTTPSEAQRAAFDHFIQHAQLCLTLISRRDTTPP